MNPSQRLQTIASQLRQAAPKSNYTTEAETKRIATELVKAYEVYKETVVALVKDADKNWDKLQTEMRAQKPEEDSEDEGADWWYEVMRTSTEAGELHSLIEDHLRNIDSVDSDLERFTRG